jgi:hypothetical protein
MIKRIIYLLALSLSITYILCSIGQAEETIGIYNIASAEGNMKQSLGQNISLQRTNSPIKGAAFHARIFRGTIEKQKLIKPDSEGCVKYFTVLLKVRITDTVNMRSLDDPAWLTPAEDGFQPEQYTIVFETGDQPTDSTIRIKKADIDKYFKYAIVITLDPPDELKCAVQKMVEAAKKTLEERTKIFQSIKDSTCWNIRLMADGIPVDSLETVKVAELTPCIVVEPFLQEEALTLVNSKRVTVQSPQVVQPGS